MRLPMLGFQTEVPHHPPYGWLCHRCLSQAAEQQPRSAAFFLPSPHGYRPTIASNDNRSRTPSRTTICAGFSIYGGTKAPAPSAAKRTAASLRSCICTFSSLLRDFPNAKSGSPPWIRKTVNCSSSNPREQLIQKDLVPPFTVRL